tara:strand:- start:18476 stop:19606 length:1131 start_codon:yes stop_codon:yes gene_type:complete
MKNILITGGAGFIGSNLTIHLVKKGYNITILDNLSEQIHGNEHKSGLFNSIKDIANFILGDVTSKEDWRKALIGQDAIIHLAAETGTGQSMYEIARYNEVNVLGTSHLLDILANENHSIKKIIIASSRSIYGEGKYYSSKHGDVYPLARNEKELIQGKYEPKCPISSGKLELRATDELSKIHPASIYGITKHQQEQMVMLMGITLNIAAVSLRYQNIYGPGQSLQNPYTGILSVFSTRLLNGNDIHIYEDGNQSRDFLYIDDAVNATIMALENKNADNKIFNVGSGSNISVNEVARKLHDLYKAEGQLIVNGEFRLGDIRHNYADITRISAILGFRPNVSFNDGVINFVNWVKTQDIEEDKYDASINELKDKGLIR